MNRTFYIRFGVAAVILLWLASLAMATGESKADPSIQRQRELLEKGLTLHEIERELTRIEAREKQLETQISSAENNLIEQEAAMEIEKERAGKVIRAYYTGERDTFFRALFQLERWSEVFTVIEYVQFIFESDRETIRRYTDSADDIKKTIASLEQTKAELAEVKQLYLEKRQIALETAEQLDQAIAAMANAQELEQQIAELTKDWETNGLPLFQRYFHSLAKAMNDLAEILEDGKYLTVKGLTWEFRMADDDLNRFLRKKNEIFEQITFRFEEDRIVAGGVADDRTLLIGGTFTIREEPDHHIGFSIDQLEYENFTLPHSTAREMEEQFDLSFYPKAILPFVKATKLKIDDGEISILLEIDL